MDEARAVWSTVKRCVKNLDSLLWSISQTPQTDPVEYTLKWYGWATALEDEFSRIEFLLNDFLRKHEDAQPLSSIKHILEGRIKDYELLFQEYPYEITPYDLDLDSSPLENAS